MPVIHVFMFFYHAINIHKHFCMFLLVHVLYEEVKFVKTKYILILGNFTD